VGKVEAVAVAGLVSLLFINGCVSGSPSSGAPGDKSLASEAYEKGRFDQAREYYMKILENDTDDIEALFRLGNIYAKNNQPRKAVEYYEKTIRVKSDFSPAWRNLGVVRLRQGLAAMMKSQKHLPVNDPLYISNLDIIRKLEKVPGLDAVGKNIRGETQRAKGAVYESR